LNFFLMGSIGLHIFNLKPKSYQSATISRAFKRPKQSIDFNVL
jgi:hypothetical protein